MGSFFSTTMLGRLGDDAKPNYTQGGKFFMTFSVATDRWVPNAPKETRWTNVTLFGKLAETMATFFDNGALRKGDEVLVTGEIDLNLYQKNDGTQGASLQMVARECVPTGKRREDDQQAPQQQYQQAQQQQPQQQYQQQQPQQQQGFPPPPPGAGFQGQF